MTRKQKRGSKSELVELRDKTPTTAEALVLARFCSYERQSLVKLEERERERRLRRKRGREREREFHSLANSLSQIEVNEHTSERRWAAVVHSSSNNILRIDKCFVYIETRKPLLL